MRILLDTHVILWFAEGGERFNSRARTILTEPSNDRVVSHVSLWEITIKVSTGRLRIDRKDLEQALIDMAVEELPIGREHILGVASLPFIHRDPFDRLLIAQAKIENLILATHDQKFSQYGIPLLPA